MQVARSPAAVAVEFEGQELTYLELNRRANLLARRLAALGAGPETVVGLCMHRSPDLVTALLGILKAGAAYVPLDPEYPQERLAFMLRDSGARIVVTQRDVEGRLAAPDLTLIVTDGQDHEHAATQGRDASSGVGSHNLAYILYTSGSTGVPKGVAMEHGAITNLTGWQLANSSVGAGGRTLQLASISFDVSIQEIFATWCAGGRLVMITEELRRDPERLLRFIGQRAIERIFLPFSSLQRLAECAALDARAGYPLTEIITAGEQLRITPQIAAWLQRMPACRLYNQYGPTETHVVVTNFPAHASALGERPLPPIGKPIWNTRIHILDANSRPVPDGEAGEICIGGICLARGYWRRPELDAERFIPDPCSGEPGARLYRSGDLGRVLPDGNLEFLGRLDDQVKVRGCRIELGEIEAVLQEHPHVAQTAVAAREDAPGHRRLVAYVVPAQGRRIVVRELRRHLLSRLPDFMLPASFVTVPCIPLSPNGKVDRSALPAPGDSRPALSTDYAAPRNALEQAIAAAWGELLGVAAVGVHDDFFELGGDSLSVTVFLARGRREWGLELGVQAFFAAPTVAATARHVVRCGAAVPACQESAPSPAPSRREGVFPLGSDQEALWIASQLQPELPTYNEPFSIHLHEAADAAAMQIALDALVKRHEILRTAFEVIDGRPVQRVLDELVVPVEEVEAPAGVDGARPVPPRIETLTRGTFDLRRPPLLRAALLRAQGGGDRLVLVMHHLLIDAIGFYGVLMPELAALYDAARHRREASLPALPLQYGDFVLWQRARLRSPEVQRNVEHWVRRLRDLPRCDLPADRPRPARRSGRGGVVYRVLRGGLEEQLAAVGRRVSATPYMTLCAAFAALLGRYTGLGEVVVGTQEAGRDRAELEGLLGYFVRTLVLRTDVSGDPTFLELLGRVRTELLDACEHRDYPLFAVLERLDRQRSTAWQPLYQIAFILEPELPAQPSGWGVSQYEVHPSTARFDLALQVEATPDGLVCALEYDSDLFDRDRIERMAGHFETLLEAIVRQPEERVSRLQLLSEAELRQLLLEWNDTAAAYPRDRCVHELIAEQAQRTPEAVAVACGEASLRYAELEAKANQLAHHLRALGVGPDVLVGVHLERSLELVVGLLGVLKAGGAYVPLDPSYPAHRLGVMLEDAAAPVLLTQRSLLGNLPGSAGRVVCLDKDWGEIAVRPSSPVAEVARAHDLAYVIYTSGSTGAPKGVMIEHRALANHMAWMGRVFPLGAGDRVLQKTPIGGDASVWEFFAPLLAGARLVMAAPGAHRSTLEQVEAIREQGITVLQLVPSMLAAMLEVPGLEGCETLRRVFCGGEALLGETVQRFRQQSRATLVNLYGPTEVTIDSVFHVTTEADEQGAVPIGRPVDNLAARVCDAHGQLAPQGVPGELYLGGDGVARGYLNRPELTRERFVPDPAGLQPERVFYRTGDLARWREGGVLEFLGRADQQVKIRGARVELGEIEAVLAAHPDVADVAVAARSRGRTGPILVAYVIPAGEKAPGAAALRDFARARLPEAMVPTAFVVMEAFPRLPNAKVDRQALPEPALETASGVHRPPSTPMETLLAKIWMSLLQTDRVGLDDSFFDRGGHSLLAMQLMARIAAETGVELTVREIFEAPSLGAMALALTAKLPEPEASG